MNRPESTIKNICMRTTSSLILGLSKLQASEGTGAHHPKGDAIRANETALIMSSRKVDDGLGMGGFWVFPAVFPVEYKMSVLRSILAALEHAGGHCEGIPRNYNI